VLGVGVQDAQSGIEPDSSGSEGAFGFGEGVAVVEEGVDGVGSVAGAVTGEGAAPCGEPLPMFGYPATVLLGEAAAGGAGPCREVGVGGGRFQGVAGT
jgi:hypothetical protein